MSLWKHFTPMSPFTLTLDTSWVVLSVTITMMDQLSPGAGTVCHVSCTRGVCSLLQHCNMSLVSSGDWLIQHWHGNRVIQLKKSSNKQRQRRLGGEDVRRREKWLHLLQFARLLMISCIFSYARPAPQPELLTMRTNKNSSLSLLTPSTKPAASGPEFPFHWPGAELWSVLWRFFPSWKHEL